jgi:hypothetical protein
VTVHSAPTEITFEPNSTFARIEASCFERCSLASICIPASVAELGRSSFSNAKIDRLTFGSKSRLTRIEKSSFESCALKSIHIPKNVDFVDRSTIDDIESVTVDGKNQRFKRVQDLLVDLIDCIGLRYFGGGGNILVCKEVKILGRRCFRKAIIKSMTFQLGSKLTDIEGNCFFIVLWNRFVFLLPLHFLVNHVFSRTTIDRRAPNGRGQTLSPNSHPRFGANRGDMRVSLR